VHFVRKESYIAKWTFFIADPTYLEKIVLFFLDIINWLENFNLRKIHFYAAVIFKLRFSEQYWFWPFIFILKQLRLVWGWATWRSSFLAHFYEPLLRWVYTGKKALFLIKGARAKKKDGKEARQICFILLVHHIVPILPRPKSTLGLR
jgi:hypothetical protein